MCSTLAARDNMTEPGDYMAPFSLTTLMHPCTGVFIAYSPKVLYTVYLYLKAEPHSPAILAVLEFFFQDFVGSESKPGSGRKREPKSTGNGNMEESLTRLFSPRVLEVQIFSLVFS
ncbi:hypothetical protein BRADI_5g10564v3 [Brachypodium distachyon]|uniref:Uncharacterized protein n=1 Tax=Brachypodium distachyon TaxID=15368 RepID=A0A2K2CGI1_BRADI|nr:hypothetical protein BRADI_5g10564v3 [Brachypodium distachyon]